MEEERRLFYVALTRARKNVHLIHARTRMKYGKTAIQRPSSFLFELPDEISERLDSSTAFKPMGKDELKEAWAALYAIGDQAK